MAHLVKNLPAMQETWVRSLGWEDPLEKGKATPLQYSGLETSMDCIVHGVAQSWTRLSDFHSPAHSLWTVRPPVVGRAGNRKVSQRKLQPGRKLSLAIAGTSLVVQWLRL